MSAAELDLNVIEARANAATDGPWTTGYRFGHRSLGPSVAVLAGDLPPIHLDPHRNGRNDAAFIAHARQDVPALVAEVRRLRAALTDAQPKILTTEPGPEVTAVWDCDGDKWTRHPEGWQRGPFGQLYPWGHVLIWAPITAAPRPTAAGR